MKPGWANLGMAVAEASACGQPLINSGIDSIEVTMIAGLRDGALIGLMAYSFARIGSALGMKIEDVFTQNRRLPGRARTFEGLVRAECGARPV